MSHALTAARRTVEYVRVQNREISRLRSLVEKLTGEAMAAKTAAAHLRDEVARLKAEKAGRHAGTERSDGPVETPADGPRVGQGG